MIKEFYEQKLSEKKLQKIKRKIFFGILATIIIGGPIWLIN